MWTFPRITEPDLPRLLAWHRQPHVLRWWPDAPTRDELAEDWLAAPPAAQAPFASRGHIACLDGRPLGFVQAYHVMSSAEDGWWPDERDPGAWGVDFFIGEPSAIGCGLGRTMLRAFTEALLAEPGVRVVQSDPAPDNLRSVRALLAAGFAAQRLVRTPDGPALLLRRWPGR